MNETANIGIWLGFSLFLVIALSLDTYFINKGTAQSRTSVRTAIVWTLIWVTSALVFNALLWLYLYYHTSLDAANEAGLDFFTGYLIEKSLSIDNLFAFYLVFKQFNIPPAYQPRIFSYGIWGAIVFRLLLIWIGISLVDQFFWIFYIMGAFLVCMGLKMMFSAEKEKYLTETFTFKISSRFLRIASSGEGRQFFIKQAGLLYATPLFLALIFIEVSDIVFAFDSIPAILAITTDPFIVWTSNIFAILGLRALYFLLAESAEQFHLLKYGIALILVFIGCKMLIEPWQHIPVLFSLSVIVSILLLFIVLSLLKRATQGN